LSWFRLFLWMTPARSQERTRPAYYLYAEEVTREGDKSVSIPGQMRRSGLEFCYPASVFRVGGVDQHLKDYNASGAGRRMCVSEMGTGAFRLSFLT
jgi:hypothetical protein